MDFFKLLKGMPIQIKKNADPERKVLVYYRTGGLYCAWWCWLLMQSTCAPCLFAMFRVGVGEVILNYLTCVSNSFRLTHDPTNKTTNLNME